MTESDNIVDLCGDWRFAVSDWPIALEAGSVAIEAAGLELLPAVVPGNLELDLLRHGLIDDPFRGMNIVELRRLERAYAYYVRQFEVPTTNGGTPVLVFEGLDCFARVVLNGVEIATTDNMLVEHRVPIDRDLLRSDNELVVELSPALGAADDAPYVPGLQAEGGNYAALRIRKAPHMFGWDIMPRALSAGIWRPARIEFPQGERIDWLWLDTISIDPAGTSATVVLHYDLRTRIDPMSRHELVIRGRATQSSFEHRAKLLSRVGQLRFDVADPELWWPRGRGDPALYDTAVAMLRDGTEIDRQAVRFGIRTVELERTSIVSDEGEGTFRFTVNGEPIFALGTNWVPLDAYHSRDRERLDAALALVDELGCNMIRCWGGNVYEDDRFYDWCDEHGVLVWQDFAMACATYPQDEAFQSAIRDEVRAVVRRLRQHPSVVVWAGDNECDEQYVWKARPRDPNTNVLTRQVIPEVLRAEDPSRPYLPSSPFVDPVAFASGERRLPEDHLWGPRDDFSGPYFRDAVASFASEIGFLGAPSVESLRAFLTPEHLWPPDDNPEWLLHSTSPFPGVDTHDYRVPLISTQIRSLFDEVPTSLEAFVEASQATQAEALKSFIERFRTGKWRTTGILWWNLLDGWPQFSDAIVDYYFRRKRAFDVVRRAQAPILVALRDRSDGALDVLLCNDTRDDCRVDYEIRDVANGRVLVAKVAMAQADAVTSSATIPTPNEQTMLALAWASELGPGRSHHLVGDPPFDLGDYRRWFDLALSDRLSGVA